MLGTLAFSACNLLMAAEAWYLERCVGPAEDTGAGSKGGAPPNEQAMPSVQTPCLRSTLAKHFCYLLLLLAARGTTSRLVYSVAKVVVLGCLFANYNQGLLTGDGSAAPADGVGSPLIRSPSCQYLMATLHIPAPAKRAYTQRPTGWGEGWMGMALVWLVGFATLGQASRRAATPPLTTTIATSLLRRAGAEPKHAARAPLAFGQGIGLHQRVSTMTDAAGDGASNIAAAAAVGQQDRREL